MPETIIYGLLTLGGYVLSHTGILRKIFPSLPAPVDPVPAPVTPVNPTVPAVPVTPVSPLLPQLPFAIPPDLIPLINAFLQILIQKQQAQHVETVRGLLSDVSATPSSSSPK